MKALTEQETKLMEALEVIQKEFEAFPYHLSPPNGDERKEFRKRIDEAKYIIAIRGMLRDGGHNITISAADKQWIEKENGTGSKLLS